MVYYTKGLHGQYAFSGSISGGWDFKNTDYLVQRVLSLPVHPYLEEEDINKISCIINNIQVLKGETI